MDSLIEIGSNYFQDSNLAAMFLDAWLKSFVVLALAGGLCLGWRRASAATRHWVWFLAMASLVCLPWLSFTLPAWQRPLWAVSTDLNSGNKLTLAIEFAPDTGSGIFAHETPTALTGTGTPNVGAVPSARIQRLATHFNARWLVVAPAIWITGVVLVFSFVTVGRLRLRRIRRRSQAPRGADWMPLLNELCQELDIRRSVILLQSADDVMPATWGWWRPVILLPAAADQWPLERQRVVLLHELAHVKRWDCLTRMITRIVCAVYWFNPLVWLAARRMCVERERACDDLVLNGGLKASDYASHLVEIARTFRRVPQAAAIAMARSSGLERRVTALLDGRRNRNRIAKVASVFIALGFLGLEFVIGANAMKPSAKTWSLERSIVSAQLKHFVAEKAALASAAAKAEEKEMLPEFKTFIAAAEKGDWLRMSNRFEDLRRPASQGEGSASKACVLRPIEWSTALEIWGAFEQFAGGGEKYCVAFGNDAIASIPPGSIYFGGTDPGRFLITALCKSHGNADPFFTLTQRALADNGYLQYLQRIYGTRIYVPSLQDGTNAFNQYLEDARRRLKENKLTPGEDVKEVDGKMQVSGWVGVMAVNGLIAKLIFDRNPAREFYIEESFPLDWMYPHLSPHRLIMKINRQPLDELSDQLVRQDHEYWTRYVQPMLGDWLNYGTTVAEIAAFVEKVFVTHDLRGFNGDPQFVRNDSAQKMFSKLRSSIAGVYYWRISKARNPAEKERMLKEADFAFRQAFALCPSSLEAVFRYINMLVDQKRLEDAVLVAEAALKVEPQNNQCQNLLEELKRMKTSQKN